jgi:haloalkane dehalogenase
MASSVNSQMPKCRNTADPSPNHGTANRYTRFPNELPIAGNPPDVYAMAVAYHQWLLETETAKILFHAAPGLFVPPARAHFYATHLKNCRVVDLGHGDHYLPEDHPDTIGREISAWLTELP